MSGDENESVSYHLLHDENKLPVPFRLDETGRLLSTGSLDYEIAPNYEVEVSAWSGANENIVHTFTIEVLDIYEAPFDFNATALKIAEDAPIGSEVGQFIQVSGEENVSVSYHLLDYADKLPVPFRLDETGRLLSTGSLDYETDPSYAIEVSAWSGANKNVVHTFTIEVLDMYEAPFDFDATALKIAEDAPIGSEVGQFIQVSGDENESVSYHLLHDENKLPVPFRLDETGRLLSTGSLDYETDPNYEVEVSAWTEGNENIIHTFTIEVLDMYEAPFDFDATALKIAEDAPIGSEVGQFIQVSGDENERCLIIYCMMKINYQCLSVWIKPADC